MSQELEFTGERFIPGTAGEIWHEHWHRYHFAAPLVAGLDVLDVACGEGYGSALLAARARSVIGADIAPGAVDHARSRYAAIPNLEFRQADCAALPFADASFDVVSFETIEHILTQAPFLDEIRRVLRPDAFPSSPVPTRRVQRPPPRVTNEFHVRELYRAELAALLAPASRMCFGTASARASIRCCGPSKAPPRARSSRFRSAPPRRRRRAMHVRSISSSWRAPRPCGSPG
jgi:SAM-dependent methyltransferase